jgi:hypothetical protein
VCGPCGESRPTSRLARAGRTWWPVLVTDALTARRNRSHALAAPLLRTRQPAGLAIRAEQENRDLASGNRGGLLDGFEDYERAALRDLLARIIAEKEEEETGTSRAAPDPVSVTLKPSWRSACD